jgi:PII-like signaling protein
MGYGASSTFHTAKILQLSFDLPIVIECIDTQEKLDAFLPTLQSMMSGGLITTQPVEVLHHQSKPQS